MWKAICVLQSCCLYRVHCLDAALEGSSQQGSSVGFARETRNLDVLEWHTSLVEFYSIYQNQKKVILIIKKVFKRTMHAVLQMSAGVPYPDPINTSRERYCRVWISSVKCLCWWWQTRVAMNQPLTQRWDMNTHEDISISISQFNECIHLPDQM